MNEDSLDYLRSKPHASSPADLDAILGERARLLAEILADVREQLHERDELSRDVINRIWQEYLELRAELLPLLATPIRFDRSLDVRRASLEDRLDRVRSQARQEETQRWSDVAVLRREEREWLRQHRDLMERLSLLEGSYNDQRARSKPRTESRRHV